MTKGFLVAKMERTEFEACARLKWTDGSTYRSARELRSHQRSQTLFAGKYYEYVALEIKRRYLRVTILLS